MIEQSADVWYQEQMRRKMTLKDELREKIISMFEIAAKESLLLRKENEELQKENSKLVKERINRSTIVKEYMDCKAKVNLSLNYVPGRYSIMLAKILNPQYGLSIDFTSLFNST